MNSFLAIFFTFYFRNFSLPHTLTKCEKLRNSLKEKTRGGEFTIDLHFGGEHWDDPLFTRRFLLASNPHLHYKKNIVKKEISALQDLCNQNSTINLEISIVQGGSGGAELKIDNLQISDDKRTDFLKSLKSFQEETTKKEQKDFSILFSLNRFFAQEINSFKEELVKIDSLESVKWDEFTAKDKADYIVAIQKDNNKYKYVAVPPPDDLNNKNNCFYQQPYLVLYYPYPKDREKRVEVINDYFGGIPLLVSERVFLKNDTGKESVEKTLKEAGIGKLVIKNEKEEDIAEIYIDPTKILVFTKQGENLKQIKPIIHRALFFARTIMHYCILWDARLQIIFQEIYETLKEVRTQQNNFNELFKLLETLNNIQLSFVKDEAELYNSFVWRYSSFLPSNLGYLSTIYEQMEKIFDLRDKMENIRNSITEIRHMFEFTSNIIRGFIVPALPELLIKKKAKVKRKSKGLNNEYLYEIGE